MQLSYLINVNDIIESNIDILTHSRIETIKSLHIGAQRSIVCCEYLSMIVGVSQTNYKIIPFDPNFSLSFPFNYFKRTSIDQTIDL